MKYRLWRGGEGGREGWGGEGGRGGWHMSWSGIKNVDWNIPTSRRDCRREDRSYGVDFSDF